MVSTVVCSAVAASACTKVVIAAYRSCHPQQGQSGKSILEMVQALVINCPTRVAINTINTSK
jgi:hypothetical protein